MNAYCISWLFIAVVVAATLQNAEASSCYLRQYHALVNYYKQCSVRQRTLQNLNDEKSTILGKNVVNVLNNYCKKRHSIHTCVKEYFTKLGCSAEDKKWYDRLAAKSDFYCNTRTAKTMIADMYKDIPGVPSSHSDNKCVLAAQNRKRGCIYAINNHLNYKSINEPVERQGWTLGTMVCTLQIFQKDPACPMEKGLLITTLNYAESMVPPLLGVNVTHVLLDMKHLVQQT